MLRGKIQGRNIYFIITFFLIFFIKEQSFCSNGETEKTLSTTKLILAIGVALIGGASVYFIKPIFNKIKTLFSKTGDNETPANNTFEEILEELPDKTIDELEDIAISYTTLEEPEVATIFVDDSLSSYVEVFKKNFCKAALPAIMFVLSMKFNYFNTSFELNARDTLIFLFQEYHNYYYNVYLLNNRFSGENLVLSEHMVSQYQQLAEITEQYIAKNPRPHRRLDSAGLPVEFFGPKVLSQVLIRRIGFLSAVRVLKIKGKLNENFSFYEEFMKIS